MSKKGRNSTISVWRPDAPYNALPDLPPPGELETKLILKQCIRARAALAELKQAAELIPNQGMLINTLPLLEAQASSEIENIVTTADRLFQFQNIGDRADAAAVTGSWVCADSIVEISTWNGSSRLSSLIFSTAGSSKLWRALPSRRRTGTTGTSGTPGPRKSILVFFFRFISLGRRSE